MNESKEVLNCPECGGTEIGKGKHSGYAVMTPGDKLMTLGSEIVYTLCTDCGFIIKSYVKNPKKFK
ncbi:transcription initiation factor TFIIIB [Hazenella sp. IB182357]|uniref:Transcription initiation factor TFIIIB n=1 Tax=Polycladospora coralii TaxID=2771432 RepID=A0A926RXT3_9BACL|nr:transcription initiation factor TFIIIB [Polycladospora coralii]MBD1372826.1 transcription initiation factor TFIIIB [Polycladospora coralii]MBS7529476.1 transcription initiation factor TFIIIB [Polycladospora coralii]